MTKFKEELFEVDNQQFVYKKKWYDRFVPVIFIFFLIFLAWLIYPDLRDGYYSKNWPSVNGTVTESRMFNNGGSKGCNEKLIFKFRFLVEDIVYTGDHFRFGNECNHNEIMRIVANYPPGKIVTVYFNPNHPARCVLEQGIASDSKIGIGVFVFLTMAAFIIILAIR